MRAKFRRRIAPMPDFAYAIFYKKLADDMTPRQDSCQESSSAPAKEGQRLRANSIATSLMIPASFTMSTGLLRRGCFSNGVIEASA